MTGDQCHSGWEVLKVVVRTAAQPDKRTDGPGVVTCVFRPSALSIDSMGFIDFS